MAKMPILPEGFTSPLSKNRKSTDLFSTEVRKLVTTPEPPRACTCINAHTAARLTKMQIMTTGTASFNRRKKACLFNFDLANGFI
jgi:hypothetical protein